MGGWREKQGPFQPGSQWPWPDGPCAVSPKLHQSQLELQEVRLSCRQLQGKVEELTEERSLQSSAATSTSLLSEIEQSMEAEELEQEREQVLLPPPNSGTACGGPGWPGQALTGSPAITLLPRRLPQWEPVRAGRPAGQGLVGMLVTGR